MPEKNSSPTDRNFQTFRMGPGMKWVINSLLLLLIAPFLWGLIAPSEPLLALGVVMLPFAGILWYFTRKVYLQVGPEGIQLQNYQLTTFVPWANFSQLVIVPANAGIELIHPVDASWSRRLAKGNLIEKGYGIQPVSLHAELLNSYRFVELKPFRHWVINGDLAVAISRYTQSTPQVTNLSRATE